MAKKSCKKGYYYCNTDKKCKKIPKGYHVMPTGYLMRDSEHQDENKEETKKKNGNGNGANGNGNGNGGTDGVSDGGGVSESKDHEVAMAQSQLKKSAKNIAKLRKALGKKEKDIPAWMQAKITDTAHDTDAAAGYVDKMDEEVIAEKRDGKSAKDKGYSLRDWFKGGGWVQAGGKYDGKPCAKQPGQKTKPFCRDADDRANMSKKERSRRAAKKRREDPNPDRTGKAKMVSASFSDWKAELQLTERDAWGTGPMDRIKCADGVCRTPAEIEKLRLEKLKGKVVDKAHYEPQGEMVDEEGRSVFSTPGLDRKKKVQDYLKNTDKVLRPQKPTVELDKAHFEPEGELVDEGKKDACYHKVKSRYKVWPSAYASGALVKCRKVGAKNWGNKTKKEGFSNWREDMLLEGLEDKLRQMSPEQIEDLIKANKGAEEKIRKTLAKLKTATPNPQGKGAQLPNVPKSKTPTQPASTSSYTSRETYQRGGSDRVSYQRRPRPSAPKSAPKVKVKPRMRGGKLGLALTAAGLAAPIVMKGIQAIKKRMEPDIGVHKYMQKEGYEYSNWRDDFQATEYESVDIIKTEPLQPTQGLGSNMVEAKTKAERLKEISKQLAGASKMHAKQSKAVGAVADELEEAKKCWKGYKKAGTQKLFGKTYNRCVKAHFSDWRAEMNLQEKKADKDYDGDGKIESGSEEYLGSRDKAIKKAMGKKKNCGCGKDPCETYGKQEVKEDWQKSNRKDGVDGMSQKSVNAYKRENPGSKLQTAVTEKKPTGKRAKRRKSFCARSKGQKDMHNIDCSKTPDKKICKARKRWRC